ncbi:FISUMP domain-containing protein [Dysgonomonas sp. 25]|uniref:FISUMP domain-containing protein n=1 Tax=Dysgonomonas sp. 25 TaxID=2302933 RepID=UPI0013D08E2B|nr:FISUMP domain-containing protein [Dysgonomonas sp. 25]NDV68792.1 hypothetical protein [Dysgonomonas sp. 25]NDV70174.1 hypothetical protein [Dysgonomonas sp. 25]
MKRILFTHMLLLMLLSATMTGHAQVTIGSGEKPNKGALLDLKQTNNEISSTKGVILPRVQLTDLNNLFPMFESDDNGGYKNAVKADEDKLHTGMIVFNTASSVLLPEGVYIWDGSKWTKGAEEALAKLHLSESRFDLPSGKDARTLTAQELVINWMDGASPTYNAAAASGFTAVPFTGNPLTPATLTTSPTTISLLPDAMTDTDVTAANPWKTKETELSFLYTDTDEDGNSKEKIKTVTINQTNFALKAKDRLRNAQITYTAATSGNFNVQGNASWKAEITGMESAATFTVAAEGGKTLTDGTTNTTNVPYTTNAGNRYDYANVTFKDAETPKRFEDVTVSMVNCVTGNDPSIEEWARRAGFTDDEIAAVTNADAGSSAIKPINLIQLHRDQDDNLFLSGDFGNAGRWMLHNVRALNYSSKAPHSQGRTLTYSYATTYNVAQWGYPNASQTLFDNNPRVGLVYNWDAATGGKGGANGQATINDGENITTTPTPVQGICPDGWHLPSEYEWTQLDQEITTNTNLYSGTADIGGTITIGSNTRGTHAKGMKAPCSAPTSATVPNGYSNTISISSRPGMNLLLTGYYTNNSTYEYGSWTMFWTPNSGGDTTTSYYRQFKYTNEHVERVLYFRHLLLPLRCKKNE